MDNGLVLCNEVKYGTSDFAVLILIIVDNGLVPKIRQNMPELSCCINPCCSGQWSSTSGKARSKRTTAKSLNPCCSGQWSSTFKRNVDTTTGAVLILVVVDNGLVLYFLIFFKLIILSLNPCCSGQWSSTA